jgi:hypothetical protein
MQLIQALQVLARDWKQEVEPGTTINDLLDIITNDATAAMSNLTSSSPPDQIAATLWDVLGDCGQKVLVKAQRYANQYRTPMELVGQESLEGFLSEVALV